MQGERSFFLQPGEKLEKGIQNIYILGEDEGVILKANEAFMDTEDGKKTVRGPSKYLMPAIRTSAAHIAEKTG